MLSEKIVNMLNDQITLEAFSSNYYTAMAAWCHFKGFEGCGKFMELQAEEELLHMRKLFSYVIDSGGLPKVGAIPEAQHEFSSIKEVLQKTRDHEREITASINNLVASCWDERDFSTFNFLQWYVSEQHEEEKTFQTILDKVELIGLEGRGLFLIDKEIAGLARARMIQPQQ